MSENISEIIHQWEAICIGWTSGSISSEVAKEFHAKHGPAIVAESIRLSEIQRREERSRPCPYCKAEVGKPCKDKYLNVVMVWQHSERCAKEGT
jgi:hypothetical protein